jgi:protein-S-isoprenylcysteine O-methyltransferase Ste14
MAIVIYAPLPLLAGQVSLFLLTAFFWLAIRICLTMEEAYLRRIFGEHLEDYCRRTSRYRGIQSG